LDFELRTALSGSASRTTIGATPSEMNNHTTMTIVWQQSIVQGGQERIIDGRLEGTLGVELTSLWLTNRWQKGNRYCITWDSRGFNGWLL
jgi:hypothetical protein